MTLNYPKGGFVNSWAREDLPDADRSFLKYGLIHAVIAILLCRPRYSLPAEIRYRHEVENHGGEVSGMANGK